MDIDVFLAQPGAPSVREFAAAAGIPDQAMVRQWMAKDEHGQFRRRPGPAFAVSIERASGGQVPRWETRPDDWYRIWPELIGSPGVPPVPAPAAEAA